MSAEMAHRRLLQARIRTHLLQAQAIAVQLEGGDELGVRINLAFRDLGRMVANDEFRAGAQVDDAPPHGIERPTIRGSHPSVDGLAAPLIGLPTGGRASRR